MASTNSARPDTRLPTISSRNARLVLFGLISLAILALVATSSGIAPVVEPDATASSAASVAREDLSFRAGLVGLAAVLTMQVFLAWAGRSASRPAASGTKARPWDILFAALFKIAGLIIVIEILVHGTSLVVQVFTPDYAVHGRTFPILVAIPILAVQLWRAWSTWKRPRGESLMEQDASHEQRMEV